MATGTNAGQTPRSTGSAPVAGRSLYQQRLDQIKIRIMELSRRNMENSLRILREWMADK